MKINNLNKRMTIYDIKLSPDNYCGHVEEQKELCTIWAEIVSPKYRSKVKEIIVGDAVSMSETLDVNIRRQKSIKVTRGMKATFAGQDDVYVILNADYVRRDMVTLLLRRETVGL